MPNTQERARDSPLAITGRSANHRGTIADWASELREIARGRKPLLPRLYLAELLKNDDPKSIDLLSRITAAILKGKRPKKNTKYYLIAEKGGRELWGAFLNPDDKIFAPDPRNLFSYGKYPTALILEVREGDRCLQKSLVVAIAEGKLDITGNRQMLFSFLS